MQFVIENYLIIILIGLFIVFALIGFLVDMIKNNNNIEKKELPKDITPIEVTKINEKALEPEEKKNSKIDNADELLSNYESDVSKKL